jgi:hypothetical protein
MRMFCVNSAAPGHGETIPVAGATYTAKKIQPLAARKRQHGKKEKKYQGETAYSTVKGSTSVTTMAKDNSKRPLQMES